jgi:hypothetical protein
MKNTFCALFALVSFTNAFGQKTEFNLSLNSGLFSFSGRSAQNASVISWNDQTNSGTINNVFGSKPMLSYGLSGNVKRVSKRNFIFGADLGYETLKSKILINEVYDFTGTTSNAYNASGRNTLSLHYLNIFPYVGHRFNSQKLSFDLIGGFELSHCLSFNKKGNATDVNGKKYGYSYTGSGKIETDKRVRIQFSVNYHKTGIYLGYSYGLENYLYSSLGGVAPGCFARLFRFGFTYRIY